MKVFYKMISTVLLSAGIIAFASCSDKDEFNEAKITSFSFLKTKNSEILNKTVTGSINDETKVITVYLEEALYSSSVDRKKLVSSVSVSSGAKLLTKTASLDFSVNAVLISVCSDDETVTYSVNIVKSGDVIRKNAQAVHFTEYYNGAEFAYKGENNQFLEISNVSDAALDLSSVYLNRHVWIDGVRHSELDQRVPLSGIKLAAGKSLVIYSQRTVFPKSFKSDTGAVIISDAGFNGIISFSGQDAFTLTCGKETLDALGPENGEGNGHTWGSAKQLQRKADIPYTTYKVNDWIVSEATNTVKDCINTAGIAAVKANETTYTKPTGKALTYFCFENSTDYNKVDIDETKKTVTVNFYSDKVSLVQVPFFSSDGSNIRLVKGGKEIRITSGETEIDFKKSVTDPEYLAIRVYTNDGSSYEDYKISTVITVYNMSTNLSGNYQKVDVSEVKDGDVILLASPSACAFLGSAKSGTALECVDEALETQVTYMGNMAALCVSIRDGKYLFTYKGKFLASTANSSLSFEGNPSDNAIWSISKGTGDGAYIIKNNAGRAIEYYKSSFGSYTGSGTDYDFYIYKNLSN